MSIQYDVGFTQRPKLADLDSRMASFGFKPEPPDQREGNFTRVYVLSNALVPRGIEFFYETNTKRHKSEFGRSQKEVKAYGALKTYSTEPAHQNLDDRQRIIASGIIKTERDYYRYLESQHHIFYEISLAIRDHFNALLYCDGRRINPDRPFPFKT